MSTNYAVACTGLEALEPWERIGFARRLLGRWTPAFGDAAVHPRGAALRPGGGAPPARQGGCRRHAQQPLDYAPCAHGASSLPRSELCGRIGEEQDA
jgi:hypothetical protein